MLGGATCDIPVSSGFLPLSLSGGSLWSACVGPIPAAVRGGGVFWLGFPVRRVASAKCLPEWSAARRTETTEGGAFLYLFSRFLFAAGLVGCGPDAVGDDDSRGDWLRLPSSRSLPGLCIASEPVISPGNVMSYCMISSALGPVIREGAEDIRARLPSFVFLSGWRRGRGRGHRMCTDSHATATICRGKCWPHP